MSRVFSDQNALGFVYSLPNLRLRGLAGKQLQGFFIKVPEIISRYDNRSPTNFSGDPSDHKLSENWITLLYKAA